jgi:hypothetical protein
VAGTNGAVYTRSLSAGSWRPWIKRGGGTATDVAVASQTTGTAEIDVRGTNGRLYSMRGTGTTFGGWHDDGGLLSAGPFSAGASGRVELYILGSNTATYLRVRTTTTWGAWTRLPA